MNRAEKADQESCLRDCLRAVCAEDGCGGLTLDLLYSALHGLSEGAQECPVPVSGSCTPLTLPLLRSLKAAATVSVSRCVLTAIGSMLTRHVVRALPSTFTDHLDIDFFADLEE